jgi:hypothetical protein
VPALIPGDAAKKPNLGALACLEKRPGAGATRRSGAALGWTFKGPRALRALTGGDREPGALVYEQYPSGP